MRPLLAATLLVAVVALGACGGNSGGNDSRTAPKTAAGGGRSLESQADIAARSRRHGRGERYPGAYSEGADICGTGSRAEVAKNVRSKSTDPEKIARALAAGYLPKYRKPLVEGCLSALK